LKAIRSNIWTINKIRLYYLLVLFLCISLLSACSLTHEYEQYEGITYIAPVGHPPADTLVWSPVDPNKILVTASEVGFRDAQVYILDIDKGQKTILLETESGDIYGDTWSPDGRYIILTAAPETMGYEQGGVWLWDTDKSSLEVFINSESYSVDWSPDGKTLALATVTRKTSDTPREISLSLLDIDSMEEEVIFTGTEDQHVWGLSWSPDGRQLVFSLGTLDTSNLHLLEVHTRQTDQLTKEDDDVFPEWSPKGNLIAYGKYKNVDGKNMYFISFINPEKKCEIQIPYPLGFVFSSTWSPDGKKIAFVGSDGIYTLELEAVFGEEFYREEFPCP